MLNKYLDVAPEVRSALDAGKPVVALESTIISHGMPYPQNVETALNVEKIIRDNGAVPATIAVIKGRLKAGLSREEIDYLGRTGHAVPKASRRDLPVLVAQGRDGACTVTTTMALTSGVPPSTASERNFTTARSPPAVSSSNIRWSPSSALMPAWSISANSIHRVDI